MPHTNSPGTLPRGTECPRMWVSTESSSIPLDGELRDAWDLERDAEEPRDNVLPVRSKNSLLHTLTEISHFFISSCSQLTPWTAQCGLGQTSSSQGLFGRSRQTILLILTPKQPTPLVPLESSTTYSALVIFTSVGHHGQRANAVPLLSC